MSGMTARSTQPTEDDSVLGNQSLEAFLIPRRRPASSLVREPYARLSLSRRFARLRIILQPSEVPCNRTDDRDVPPARHSRYGTGRLKNPSLSPQITSAGAVIFASSARVFRRLRGRVRCLTARASHRGAGPTPEIPYRRGCLKCRPRRRPPGNIDRRPALYHGPHYASEVTPLGPPAVVDNPPPAERVILSQGLYREHDVTVTPQT